MTAATIVAFSEERRSETIALVSRVFAHQSPIERLGLYVFQTRWGWLLDMAGIRRGRFWLAVRDDSVIGTVGLYETPADSADADWLAWYCVAPEARGGGIGHLLLEHAINEARRASKRYLRLYTSSDPNEAAAQAVYERRGFHVSRIERPLAWRLAGLRLIYRELDLAGEL